LTAGALVILGTAAASEVAGRQAIGALGQEARETATLHAARLRTELEKFRSLPYVLARDPDVAAALVSPDQAAHAKLSNKLSLLSSEIGGQIIYGQNAAGVIVSSSKAATDPAGFTNCNCGGGRFGESLKADTLEYFAKGRAPGRSGLYITHSIRRGARHVGVVAVKVEFAQLEREWRAAQSAAFVTDENGVVLITSLPDWRYRTIGQLPLRKRQELKASGQFNNETLTPIPASGLTGPSALVAAHVRLPGEARVRDVLVSNVKVGDSGWNLHLIRPLSPAIQSARLGAGVIALLSGLLLSVAGAWLMRQQEMRHAERFREIAAREELEARVTARTSDLSAANARLVREMDERLRIQGDLHRLQDELVQANKLAALGQIVAGVAHEINQPLAAIKAYAENAGVLLDRGAGDLVRENLGIIGKLTGRVSSITDELRAFSRRATGLTTRVLVADAIEGALLLVSYRMAGSPVKLVRRGEGLGLSVRAERVRLEQVLVNLLQNALDALAGQGDSQIEVSVQDRGETVAITVSDNGPGLPPEILPALFMPFATTKPSGLGLGLVISRDIVSELGGDLTVVPTSQGASFMITLSKAA
jgi:two-component system C4-dicarboxylate transport sensor histidine kinase DctB